MKKRVVVSLVLLCVTLGWGGISVGDQVPAPRGELWVVDKSPLNFVSITLNVFDHLLWVDKDGKLVPQLATAWHWRDDRTLEMRLRQGVKFHNGEMFDAEIVRLNWDEYNQLHIPSILGDITKFKPGSKLEILAPYTIRFIFPEPDGGALYKLSVLHLGNRQFYRDLGWGEKGW